MPSYRFVIDVGCHAPDFHHELELSDHSAAWDEAVAICRDMGRVIAGYLQRHPDWELVVSDSYGRILFRFSVSANTIIDQSIHHRVH